MAAPVADPRRMADRVRRGGGEAARRRHLCPGEPPRDRVRASVDPLSPFLEVG